MFTLIGLGFGIIGKKIFGIFSGLCISFILALTALYILTAYTTIIETVIGFSITLLILSVLVVLFTLLLKRRKYYHITIAVLGFMAGFMTGAYLYVTCFKIFGWESLAASLTFPLLIGCVGGVLCYLGRKEMKTFNVTIGIMGGLTLSRGISLYFGGYPIDPV